MSGRDNDTSALRMSNAHGSNKIIASELSDWLAGSPDRRIVYQI